MEDTFVIDEEAANSPKRRKMPGERQAENLPRGWKLEIKPRFYRVTKLCLKSGHTSERK